MEWFQLGQIGWTGWQSAGWLWIDRATAALLAGGMLATGTGAWVVLDELGFPVLPQMPQMPQIPSGVPIAAETIMSPWYQSAA